jgi:aminopeptidase-like protein
MNPKCEPQLGRRGLYRQMGGTSSSSSEEAMLWVLNLSDGRHSLLDIAERSKLELADLAGAAELLAASELLREAEIPGQTKKLETES